jgi:uncharacterized membrane protein (DUF106 family)
MSQLMMFMMMPILLIIMMNPDLRLVLGLGMDICLGPTIGFKAVFPIFTIMITSIIMVICTTLLRHKYTDWISVGRQSYLQKHVREKFKEAQGNPQKMKRVQEMNAQIMKMTGDRMSTQMKTMIFTMTFSLVLFMWLWLHITTKSIVHLISTPWAVENGWDIRGNGALVEFLSGGRSKGPFPNWILLYSLFSLPVGQLLQAGLKYFTFKKRLERLDRGEILPLDQAEKAERRAKMEKEKKVIEEEGEKIDVVEGDFEVEDGDEEDMVEDEEDMVEDEEDRGEEE